MSTESIDFSNRGGVTSIEDFLSTEDLQKGDTASPELITPEAKPKEEAAGVEVVLEDLLGEGDKTPEIKKEEDDVLEIKAEEKVEESSIKIEDEITPPSGGLDYKSVIENLIESKFIEPIDAFTTEDGEVLFEDMDIDADVFNAIMEQTLDSTREAAVQNTVSTQGLSQFTQSLIDIEKEGGDIAQALKLYQTVKSPLETIDISTAVGQKQALYLQYKDILPEEDLYKLIDGHAQAGTLEAKGNAAYDVLNAEVDAKMEAMKQDAVNRKASFQKQLKEYRSSLRSSFNQFELTDTAKRNLIDSATKQDANGNFDVDNAYFEMRQNPELAAQLILFIKNKDEYDKQITNKVDTAIKKSVMKKIGLVKKDKKDTIQIKDDSRDKRKNLISLDKLSI